MHVKIRMSQSGDRLRVLRAYSLICLVAEVEKNWKFINIHIVACKLHVFQCLDTSVVACQEFRFPCLRCMLALTGR